MIDKNAKARCLCRYHEVGDSLVPALFSASSGLYTEQIESNRCTDSI